ncbi:MAG: ABC transporter substrate-binding protein [Bacillota bacterium]
MKKFLVLVVAILMVLQIAACSKQETPAAPATTNEVQEPADTQEPASETKDNRVQVNDMLWGVEPLPEKTKLVVAYIGNSSPPLTNYIATQKGWMDAVNLEIETVMFNNGPAQMEASSAGAWDCASTGIGGVITGVIGHDLKVLATAARDEGGHQAFFARKDSPIVADGTGYSSAEGVYGKPETWKGKDILCAKGTTNHFTLYKVLDSLGLTLDDVNIINMDVSSANTAFLAGTGDVVGVWGSLLYTDDKKDLVMVANDAMVKTGIVTNYVATGEAWGKKREAIEKWLELCIMAGEWAEANLQKAAEMMVEMNADDGFPSKVEDCYTILDNNPYATLEDNYKYYTEKNEKGDMLIAEAQIYDAMSIFVKMGNYTEEQLNKLLAGDNFVGDPVKAIYSRVYGK